MTKQELGMLKTFCDMYCKMDGTYTDMWKIYKSMNRMTPMIVDDMLDQIKEQCDDLIELINIIQNYRPERIEPTIERETLNELFGDSDAGK